MIEFLCIFQQPNQVGWHQRHFGFNHLFDFIDGDCDRIGLSQVSQNNLIVVL